MTTPNMSTITSSLERSLQNFSLNNHHHPQNSSCSSSSSNGGGNVGAGEISSSDFVENQQHHDNNNTSETAYELNSHIRMPYHWEQCLDLKSGELYYINWRTGMKSKEDPRTTSPSSNLNVGFNHSSVELYDESSYESEGSTTEESSSSPSTSEPKNDNSNNYEKSMKKEDNVLVVAGCKSCFMYFMVLKQVQDCPKCTGQLIHFASP